MYEYSKTCSTIVQVSHISLIVCIATHEPECPVVLSPPHIHVLPFGPYCLDGAIALSGTEYAAHICDQTSQFADSKIGDKINGTHIFLEPANSIASANNSIHECFLCSRHAFFKILITGCFYRNSEMIDSQRSICIIAMSFKSII